MGLAKPGAGNPQVSHMGQGPKDWAITCCLSGCLTGESSYGVEAEFEQDTGVPGGI